MKAITLTQPWASLVAFGEKRIETRGWRTDYRGPLAIHAAKTMPEYALEFCWEPAVQTMLQRHGIYSPAELPIGRVLATCQLVGVVSTNHIDIQRLGKERILGNYQSGRYAFYLEDIIRLPDPVLARGALSLWDWDEVAAGVEVVVTGRLFA